MNPEFWRNRKVLITGHTGFKGAWLSLWLQSLGAETIGYSLAPPTSPNLFELANVSEGMQSINGDVRDFEHLSEAMKRFQPQIIIHMAAQALVPVGYRQPLDTFDVNVMGTACVLEAVRRSEATQIVLIVTSDKCYEVTENSEPFREHDRLGGIDPYASSKACAELVVASYQHSYFPDSKNGPRVASARAGNVIGGGDWAEDRLIPDTVRALICGTDIVLRNPNALRPWQHVLEPLSGYLLLIEKLWQGKTGLTGAWNFGPSEDDAQPVKAVVQRFLELWGSSNPWVLDGHQHPNETRVLRLDCSKARRELAWRPHWRLEQALAATVEWYKAFLAGRDVRQLTIEQLNAYQQACLEVAR